LTKKTAPKSNKRHKNPTIPPTIPPTAPPESPFPFAVTVVGETVDSPLFNEDVVATVEAALDATEVYLN